MTVEELIQALQELNRPDLEVQVPCPHCCGQRGTDFDRLDTEHCLTMERESETVVLLGDPREQCLEDCRSDSRREVNNALRKDLAAVARSLGLQFVRTLGRRDLEELARRKTDLRIDRTIFGRLVRADLVLEARQGEKTHHVVAVSPFRASAVEMQQLGEYGRRLAQLTDGTTHQVVASVAMDQRAKQLLETGGIHWYQVSREDVDQVREEQRQRRAEEMRLSREKRAQEVNLGDPESDRESDRAAGSDPGAGG